MRNRVPKGSSERNLVLFFLICCLSCAQAGRQRKTDVHRHLKRLNKPAIKTIQSPDGDIIDCVHVSQQPAFDHPFLKNHTIQMRPSFHPEGRLYDQNKAASDQKGEPMLQLWHQNGRCPANTVPIRRTRKDDMLRASSVNKYGRKKHKSTPNPLSVDPDLLNESGHQHAIAYVEGDKYYGAKATINVWEPDIEQANEFSLSQLWILGVPSDKTLTALKLVGRLARISMGTITQGSSLTGLVMHIKQQAVTTYCALDSFK
uniref:Neprosin PEP catalytic domain-containing protein n=1 Tax=Ananas comosus var. bracteatus TaxID=296719 RepID=A0A6V7NIP1_ANACO|nr:unnamed protein product [Ananas comosus var. bracteatus]